MTKRDHEQLPLLMREADAMRRYSVGRNTLRKLAFATGGTVKIGRCLRYRRDVLDTCIDQLAEGVNRQ